jgi:MHS family proline/betaine transporter-like MFS transporter
LASAVAAEPTDPGPDSSTDASTALILTYLTFAVGFISRPLGAILFGRLGDKYGRKKALVTSMILMAIPTGCIGLLPSYEMIGVAAPILLLVIRILQGLSLGGAYSGSISYVVEHAPADKRSTLGSSIKISLVIGFLFGSMVSTLVSSLLTEEQFYSWGWRLPFFIGVGIGFVGYYIRHHGEESPVYEEAKKNGTLSTSPVRDTFFKYPQKMLRALMVYLFVTVPFYVIAIYMIAYSNKHLGMSESDALLINTIAMASMLVLIYPAAWLGDRIGRRPVLMGAIIAMLVVVYPAFTIMQSGIFINVLIAQCALAMIIGWYLGTIPATLVELFPTSVRYTGMSLAYNICAIVGGFSPSLAEYLIRSTGNNMSIMWLLVGSGALSFVALYGYKDRWREPLPA